MNGEVPAPPADLAAPNTVRVAAESRFHRIHLSRFEGASFNPCLGRPTRFAPIVDREGCCVPSLYAATTLEAAIFESLFHDIPASSGFRTVPLHDARDRSHTELMTTRTLVLAELRTPDLAKWGLTHRELVSAPANMYEMTAQWAQALHWRFTDLDGLLWTSNRCDPASALVLFGDRAADAVAVVSSRRAADDDSLLSDMRAAGARAGITLTF
ncbi:RES family NAD+ phosphorylase [Salinarimonas ramus]|uniref:RES domain-containing protein n=1 Tax=Salinarimonas ramus TaxID=690164 RepID=A0A917Q500_9HYPH|nr:RES family NAD+ phosphorylase [Salinarimonas ramus]GGK23614.1 hypothetical protein GCM10011322_07890 [Salinarimonas ramus]